MLDSGFLTAARRNSACEREGRHYFPGEFRFCPKREKPRLIECGRSARLRERKVSGDKGRAGAHSNRPEQLINSNNFQNDKSSRFVKFRNENGGNVKIAVASIVGFFLVGILAAGGMFIRGPYSAADDIIAAARATDHQRLTQLIDWPALRSSVADQIRRCTQAAIPNPSSPMKSNARDIVLSVAGVVSDFAVDILVTPDAAALAIKGLPLLKAFAPKQAADTASKPPRLVDHSVSWDSASSAYADLMFRTDSKEKITVRLQMTRSGFSDWYLSGVLFGCS